MWWLQIKLLRQIMSQTAISISQEINSRKITYFENVFVFLPTLNTNLLILESENISLVITHDLGSHCECRRVFLLLLCRLSAVGSHDWRRSSTRLASSFIQINNCLLFNTTVVILAYYWLSSKGPSANWTVRNSYFGCHLPSPCEERSAGLSSPPGICPRWSGRPCKLRWGRERVVFF